MACDYLAVYESLIEVEAIRPRQAVRLASLR
jgi:hypothetical protein